MSGAAGGAVSTVPFRTAFARLFLLRTAGTVSLRFAYPFLPTIADGLGTSLGTLGIGVACGEVAGLAAPAVGRRLDRIGRRQGMVDGLVVSSIGCAGIFLAPNVVVFGVALFLVAIGRHFFDVSFGAWIGDEVPFERRGRVSGVGELAWSGAFLVGVPIAGLLAAATSWRVPYLASAALLLASIPVVRATLAPRVPAPPDDGPALAMARPTWLHAVIFATSFGAALLFVTEGAWFETDLGFTERGVSLVVILLGVGEVVGALASAGLTDRIGKRNTIVAGLGLLIPASACFALVGGSQVAGVAAAFAVGLGFELAFVSAIPLVVEVDESRRAGALGIAVAALTVARTFSAVIGTAVFDARGIGTVVALSVPALVLALVVVVSLVREPGAATAAAAPGST